MSLCPRVRTSSSLNAISFTPSTSFRSLGAFSRWDIKSPQTFCPFKPHTQSEGSLLLEKSQDDETISSCPRVRTSSSLHAISFMPSTLFRSLGEFSRWYIKSPQTFCPFKPHAQSEGFLLFEIVAGRRDDVPLPSDKNQQLTNRNKFHAVDFIFVCR